jgi:hypothetical protein
MIRASTAAVVLALLGGCGVKGPPRAAGAPDRQAPSEIFRPPADPSAPPGAGQDPIR